jgi:hypothetical protein
MQLVGIIITLVILAIGIVGQNVKTVPEKNAGEVHSAVMESTPTPTSQPTIIVTLPPATPTPTPTTKPTNTNSADLNSFRYPGASVNASDAISMHMSSSDGADSITNWYKSKIKESGYNSTAFVVTNTNGNILTKLAASNGHTEIRVEITKSSGDSSTQITVTARTY